LNGGGRAVPVILEMAADVNTSVVASRVAENEVLLLEAAGNADVEGLVPSALLVNAVSATIEGSEGSVFATLAVLEASPSALAAAVGAHLWVSTWAIAAGVGAASKPVPAGTAALMGSGGSSSSTSLLKTFADGVEKMVPVILEVFDHVKTWGAAARVSENDMILPEATTNVIVEVLVPPAVLVYAISVIVEGSGVLELAAPAALVVIDVEGDELLDPAGAKVRAGTGIVVVMIPMLLDYVDASVLVPIAVAKDDALLLKTSVNRVGRAVPGIPEMAADVNTSVVASRVAENEVLLLEAAANADVEGLVPSALLVNAVSATIEGSRGQYLLRLRWKETSCSIQLGRRCWLARVLVWP